MIAVIDYGVGNLFSLASSLRHVGQEVLVTGAEYSVKARVGTRRKSCAKRDWIRR